MLKSNQILVPFYSREDYSEIVCSYKIFIFIPKFTTNYMRLERMREEEIIENRLIVIKEKLKSDELVS